MVLAKEQIRQIIADNNISSVADVYTLLRDGFKDILQELMEAELNVTKVRRIMYTTNIIEGLNCQYRKAWDSAP